MDDDTNDGIILRDTMHLDEEIVIDWDAVLRDFAWAHALSEQEHDAQVSDASSKFLMGETTHPPSRAKS